MSKNNLTESRLKPHSKFMKKYAGEITTKSLYRGVRTPNSIIIIFAERFCNAYVPQAT